MHVPPMDVYLQRIVDAWKSLDEFIGISFKGCAVTTVPGGSGDHLIHCFKTNSEVSSGFDALKKARAERSLEELEDLIKKVDLSPPLLIKRLLKLMGETELEIRIPNGSPGSSTCSTSLYSSPATSVTNTPSPTPATAGSFLTTSGRPKWLAEPQWKSEAPQAVCRISTSTALRNQYSRTMNMGLNKLSVLVMMEHERQIELGWITVKTVKEQKELGEPKRKRFKEKAFVL
ncbi:unnamed protein product [Caenorhabditis nigoni]